MAEPTDHPNKPNAVDDETPTPANSTRRRTRAVARLVVLCAVGFVAADHLGAFGYRGDDWARFDRQSVVVRSVLDGDMLVVQNPGSIKATIVRLIGIDAPAEGAFGHDTSLNYITARAEGKIITLRLEPLEPRDAQGNLRAYVYLSDNECLNLSLIRDGQTYADRRERHTLGAVFEQAENDARKKLRGQWKEITFDRMPVWRQDWLKSLRRSPVKKPDGPVE